MSFLPLRISCDVSKQLVFMLIMQGLNFDTDMYVLLLHNHLHKLADRNDKTIRYMLQDYPNSNDKFCDNLKRDDARLNKKRRHCLSAYF